MGPVNRCWIDEPGVTDAATDIAAETGTVFFKNIASTALRGRVLMTTRNTAPQRLGRTLVLHGLVIAGKVQGGGGHGIHGMGTAVASGATEIAMTGGITEEGGTGIHAGDSGVAGDAFGFIDPGDLRAAADITGDLGHGAVAVDIAARFGAAGGRDDLGGIRVGLAPIAFGGGAGVTVIAPDGRRPSWDRLTGVEAMNGLRQIFP